MVGRGEDTLDHAYHRQHYFWVWSDDGTVCHFPVMAEGISAGADINPPFSFL